MFGNEVECIQATMQRGIERVRVRGYGVGLDVRIMHFSRVDEKYRDLEELGGSAGEEL